MAVTCDNKAFTTIDFLTWSTVLPREQQKLTKGIQDPVNWPKSQKFIVYGVSVLTTFMAAYSISAYVAGVEAMMEDFKSSKTTVLIGMTTFQCGFAIGPMGLAPFSEINGRKPVFLATYALFNICTLIIALLNNLPGLLVVRFFQGIGASTFSTMVGGVVADLYESKSRGMPMSLFATASFSGGFGQLVSGFVVRTRGWRWIYWHQLIINGVLMLLIAILFKETRGPVLLSRKADLLNRTAVSTFVQTPGHENSKLKEVFWKVKEDEQRASLSQMVKKSLTLPFYLLFKEPVVFWFSMWISFSWALIFLFFESVTLTFSTSYGFSLQQTGLIFAAMCIGAVFGNLFYPVQDRIYRRYSSRVPNIGLLQILRNRGNEGLDKHNQDNPEARLYSACFLSIFMSAGMFMYGGTSQPSVSWVWPAIAISIVTFGAYAIYLSVFTYFADVYALYASSAMAAQSFCRNVLAGSLPLVVDISW